MLSHGENARCSGRKERRTKDEKEKMKHNRFEIP